MPGLAGIIASNSADHRARLHSMIDSMFHESFYTSGTCTEKELNLWLGWTWFKGPFVTGTPVWNQAKNICLIFSGEHFADKSNGTTSSADLAEWLRCYEKDGAEAFGRLNGWFSGVLIDHRENRITVFNDRYGINRIYYHEDAQGFH